ncbi:MAG: hypothetical protein K2Y33_09385 [Mycolicibacterium frederiksbergense]|nr:hypothetical protein [Candidatus Obscuribacterales bacterium]MBX9920021.1 hypothetical protein [Mycolicibacterium frederiksbergense]
MTTQLTAAAHRNDSVVLVGWDWKHGTTIPGCIGFAITRIDKAGKREILETHMPFEGHDNKEWKSQPSTVWPVQRKWWIDFTGKNGQTYSYEIQAMSGSPGNLSPIAGCVATSNPVTLNTKVDETFEVAFTRGILSTQWLARTLGLNAEGEPDFQKLIDALADFDKKDNVIREHLMGNVPAMLMAPVSECVTDGGHVYQALYELSSKQLVDFLLKHLSYFSLILGNTGKDDITNAEARKALHAAGAKITDRMIGAWGIAHNKSQVKVNKDKKPTDVTTGSTNWTDTGMGCQSNMVCRIFNAEVADNFMDYWNRLLADNAQQSLEFRRRNAKGYSPITLKDGTVIETYFQPSMDDKTKPQGVVPLSPWLTRVKGLMEGAKEVLVGEVFYPGTPSVVHWMAEIWDKRPDLYQFLTVSTPDALKGVKCKRRKGRHPLFTIATGREQDFADFVKELLKLPDAHAITHGKIIVIDPWGEKPVVIFGSDNLGAKASYGNDENGVIVIGNKALAQFVFVNMFDINKHFLSRAAARANRNSPRTGRLALTDAWQTVWSDGFKAREAQLLATGKWDGSGFVDDPKLQPEWVLPWQPRPKTTAVGAVPADTNDTTATGSTTPDKHIDPAKLTADNMQPFVEAVEQVELD